MNFLHNIIDKKPSDDTRTEADSAEKEKEKEEDRDERPMAVPNGTQ